MDPVGVGWWVNCVFSSFCCCCSQDGSVFLWWLELSEGKMEEDYEKETIQQRQSAEFAHPVKGIHYKKIRFCPFISAQEQKRLWFALVDGKTRTIRILQRADASPQVGASGSLFDESFLLTVHLWLSPPQSEKKNMSWKPWTRTKVFKPCWSDSLYVSFSLSDMC